MCSVSLPPSTTPLRRAPCHPASGVNTPSAATPMGRNAALPVSFVRPSVPHRWVQTHVEFLTRSHTNNVKASVPSLLTLPVTVLMTGHYDWSGDTSWWQQEDYTLWHRHDQVYLLWLLSGGLSRWCYCSGNITTWNSVQATFLRFVLKCASRLFKILHLDLWICTLKLTEWNYIGCLRCSLHHIWL